MTSSEILTMVLGRASDAASETASASASVSRSAAIALTTGVYGDCGVTC